MATSKKTKKAPDLTKMTEDEKVAYELEHGVAELYGVEKQGKFTFDEIWEVLLHVEDLLDRLILPIVFTKQLALQAVEDQVLNLDKLTFAIHKDEMTKEKRETLLMFEPNVTVGEKMIKFEFNGMPIEIEMFPRGMGWLDNIDSKVYNNFVWGVPNEWEEYKKEYINK